MPSLTQATTYYAGNDFVRAKIEVNTYLAQVHAAQAAADRAPSSRRQATGDRPDYNQMLDAGYEMNAAVCRAMVHAAAPVPPRQTAVAPARPASQDHGVGRVWERRAAIAEPAVSASPPPARSTVWPETGAYFTPSSSEGADSADGDTDSEGSVVPAGSPSMSVSRGSVASSGYDPRQSQVNCFAMPVSMSRHVGGCRLSPPEVQAPGARVGVARNTSVERTFLESDSDASPPGRASRATTDRSAPSGTGARVPVLPHTPERATGPSGAGRLSANLSPYSDILSYYYGGASRSRSPSPASHSTTVAAQHQRRRRTASSENVFGGPLPGPQYS